MIDYFKDETKAIIAQKHQADSTNKKISEIDNTLNTLKNEQNDNDRILDEMLKYADTMLDGDINDCVFSEFSTAHNSLSDLVISELDYISIDDSESFYEYMRQVEGYASRNNINLELEYEKFYSFESVELIKLKEGNRGTIICIDGFLSQNNDENMHEWSNNLPSNFDNYSVYYCKWESKRLFDIVFKFFTLPVKELFAGGLLASIPVAVVSTWKVAAKNSTKAGKSLAGLIHDKEENFILMGHSLGVNVIRSCLDSLSNNYRCSIEEVHLLGGAVSSSSSVWSNSANHIGRKMYNYMSDNDKVLKYLYRIGELDIWNSIEPVGSSRILLPSVENIDLTHLIDGHSEYRKKLSLFLQRE